MGYTELESETKLLAIVKNGVLAELCEEGDEVSVVLENTPFYAEMGGQVGDCGKVMSGDNVIEITDTQKLTNGAFVSNGRVVSGGFAAGSTVTARVDAEKRAATERNHTCAHILQAALRSVLGDHVHQSGSYVDPYQCRFDFSHFSAMTADEIQQVENYVNRVIMAAVPVTTEVLPIEEAKKRGAMALFGEKYGDVVRVVSVGDYSTEFCGGTHLTNSSQAGLFKIVSEASVSSGVRRIQAVTGMAVMSMLYDYKNTLEKACAALKAPTFDELPHRAESVMAELREKDKKLEAIAQAAANAQLGGLEEKDVNGVTLIAGALENTGADGLRKAGDSLSDKHPDLVAVLAGTADGKTSILCKCTKSAVAKGANAGAIVREIAAVAGGKGGGKPDQAMAGVPDAAKIPEALAKAAEIVAKYIK